MNMNRKALTFFLATFLLIPSALMANEEEENTQIVSDVLSSSMMNGKAWNKLDSQSKIMYLVGVEEGLGLLIVEMGEVSSEKKKVSATYSALNRLTIKGFRFSDIMEEINSFYETSSNRRIPAVDAYRHVLKKFRGASPGKLTAAEAALRNKYNR